MIYVFCERDSISARALAGALGGRRVRNLARVASGDSVVCWGESAPLVLPGVKYLNAQCGRNKAREIQQLAAADVPTPTFSLSRPEDPDGWLARAASHHEGRDLLTPPTNPAFWTRWENFNMEFRIHVFREGDEMVSVRLGAKFPRTEWPHAWIRSWGAGWHILYNREALAMAERTRGLRAAAKSAVKALGLDFGAVDVGVKARDGRPLVLEVNSAPGLEGRTLETYAERVHALLE